ncbi:hypothetical protein HBB16_04240 [Pseudonocardia sp. MCCB 268]|nr:hypothetical protein [Pseudonocardia cytotoxica]
MRARALARRCAAAAPGVDASPVGSRLFVSSGSWPHRWVAAYGASDPVGVASPLPFSPRRSPTRSPDPALATVGRDQVVIQPESPAVSGLWTGRRVGGSMALTRLLAPADRARDRHGPGRDPIRACTPGVTATSVTARSPGCGPDPYGRLAANAPPPHSNRARRAPPLLHVALCDGDTSPPGTPRPTRRCRLRRDLDVIAGSSTNTTRESSAVALAPTEQALVGRSPPSPRQVLSIPFVVVCLTLAIRN